MVYSACLFYFIDIKKSYSTSLISFWCLVRSKYFSTGDGVPHETKKQTPSFIFIISISINNRRKAYYFAFVPLLRKQWQIFHSRWHSTWKVYCLYLYCFLPYWQWEKSLLLCLCSIVCNRNLIYIYICMTQLWPSMHNMCEGTSVYSRKKNNFNTVELDT